MQNKNSIIIGADSASSYLCNNKLVRLNNTAKKLFIFGNEVMFCSGKKNVVNHIIDMIEIDGDSINKSSLQKALQDLNLPNVQCIPFEMLTEELLMRGDVLLVADGKSKGKKNK